ncbi:MAG TPA: glycosyltransferase [Ktedonobacteraceae bacterium]|nr:glycosyltransferase [Ktedonobacteraceae bacterium]
MRIAIVAFGSRGDVQPHIALGAGLQAAGHEVRLVTHELFEPLIRRPGMDFFPVQVNPRAIVEDELGKAWLGSGNNALQFFRRFSRIAAPLLRQTMLDCWHACRGTDIIICSPLAIVVISSIAEKLGIPCWIGAGQPLTPTREFAIPFFPDAPGWLPIRGAYHRLTYTLSARLFWQLLRSPINQARQEVLSLPPLPATWLYEQVQAQRLPILYYYSPSILPQPPDWGKHYFVTGYWFLNDYPDWQPSQAQIDFLARGEPPIYVGFGSMHTRRAAELTETVLEALARTKRRAILSAGWSDIGGNTSLSTNIFTVDFVPHDWLFPQTAAVVQHGGAGTMAACLRAGVPPIVVPFFGDQSFWGRRFHALGLTPQPIPQKRLTVEQLANAIQIATSDEALRQRVKAMSERIRAEDGVARAVEVVNRHLTKAHP